MFEQYAGSRLRWKESGRDTACTGRRAGGSIGGVIGFRDEERFKYRCGQRCGEQRSSAEDETAEHQSVGTEGMTPMDGSELKDGVYEIQVDSSSSMFKIEKCELTVKDGEMTADMKMGGTGYLKLSWEAGKRPQRLRKMK